MTNYSKKYYLCFVIASLLILGSLGCGSASWQKGTMVTYEATGEVLKTSLPILKAMCIDGTLNSSECKDAKEAYDDAVSIYKLLGTAAIVAIDTGERGSYDRMQAQLMELLAQLAEYTERR